MDTQLRRLTPDLLPAFVPYLTHQAVEALRQGEPVTAVGALQLPHSVGAAAGALADERLIIGSLFVDAAVRRRGIAAQLLTSLLEETGAKGAEARWILPQEAYAQLSCFFRAQGFAVTELPGQLFRVDTAGLRQAPVLRRAFLPQFRPDGNIQPLTAFSPSQLAELEADADISPPLRYAPLADHCVPQLSLGYRYGGRIAAYLLVTDGGDGSLALRSAVSREDSPPGAFVQLVMALLSLTAANDRIFWIDAAAPDVGALVERLCGPAALPCREAVATKTFA